MSDVYKFKEPFGEGFTFGSEMNSLCSMLKGVMEKTRERWENEREWESKGDMVDHGEIGKWNKTGKERFWGDKK